jgi:hypothetical protein
MNLKGLKHLFNITLSDKEISVKQSNLSAKDGIFTTTRCGNFRTPNMSMNKFKRIGGYSK